MSGARSLIPVLAAHPKMISVGWAGVLVVALCSYATAQEDVDRLLREPVCGHHQDVRGFSLDLPASLCGHRYLHGFRVGLSGDDVRHRSIVVWASGNANFYKRSRDITVAAVEALKSEAASGVHVLSRSSTAVQGVPAERWRYTFRTRTDEVEHFVDMVAVLRPLRPNPKWSDYYEYSITLDTTRNDYAADVNIFEAVLASLAFSEPET